MEAAGDVDEAELGITQMMEQAGRGSDALAQLEASLRPIERYAVRIVEEVSCKGMHVLSWRPACSPLSAMHCGLLRRSVALSL